MSDDRRAQPYLAQTERAALRDLVSSMAGRRAWSPCLGIGSFLTIEVGAPTPLSRETKPEGAAPERGEYHIWLYCTAWRIDRGTELVSGSEDDRDAIARAILRIDGRTLVQADVSDAFELTLTFDDGTVLRAFPIFTTGYEHWMIFAPNGYVYTAGPGSTWTAEPQHGPSGP